MDVSRYARFLRPGHRVTGDRSQRSRNWMRPETRVGYGYAHAIVDDHSRLAYVELHDDEKAETVTGFLARALAFYAEHGILAKRLMTDNGFSYVKNRSLRELLARHGIRHLTTEPYRPRTNGKVERFHQTMAREWAYGLAYRSHRQRNQALPHWLDRPEPLTRPLGHRERYLVVAWSCVARTRRSRRSTARRTGSEAARPRAGRNPRALLYGRYCWSSDRTVSMRERSQKPLEIGIQGAACLPATIFASASTVMGMFLGPSATTVSLASAGTR